MEIAESVEARRRGIVRHRRALVLEASAATIVLVALVESLTYIDHAPFELQAGFAMALFTFGVGLILLLHHAGELLDLECPRCQEMFYGDGVERASTPFRRRCAHCALPVSSRRSETPPQRGA